MKWASAHNIPLFTRQEGGRGRDREAGKGIKKGGPVAKVAMVCVRGEEGARERERERGG